MFTFAKSLPRLALVSVFVAAVVASTVPAQESHGPQQPTVPQGQGNLYVLSSGIGKYAEPDNDLCWMDQDAKDHYTLWKSQEGRLWRHVEPKCLINKEATGANIRRGMEEILRKAKQGDTVLFALQGHGGFDRLTHSWEFCTYDDDNLTAAELRAFAKYLSDKGVRVILIFDSCHSGAMAEIEMPNVIVLASSTASETSLDFGPSLLHGNSLFTKVLLEALGGKADANGDGVVTLAEVVTYLTQHVPAMAERYFNHAQHPKASFGGLSPETPLIQLKAPTPVPETTH